MKKATLSFPSWHSSSKMWEAEKHFPQECQNGDFIKKMKIFSAVCWLLQLRRESNLYCLRPLDYYEKVITHMCYGYAYFAFHISQTPTKHLWESLP